MGHLTVETELFLFEITYPGIKVLIKYAEFPMPLVSYFLSKYSHKFEGKIDV